MNLDSGLVVSQAHSSQASAWNHYVQQAHEGSFFHRWEWQQVLAETFKFESHFCLAERDGEVVGVLPLALVESRIFGRALVSTPGCVQGGAIAEDAEALAALERQAVGIAEAEAVDYLEIRNVARQIDQWPSNREFVRFRKPLLADPEANFKAIPRKQRAMIRKGQRADLQASSDDDVDRFYRIYASSVRDLGTPVPPKRYFEHLLERFSDNVEVLTVCKNDRPLTSVLCFFFRDQVLPYYGGGLADARRFSAHDFMYWEVMRRACERGLRVFDFGRSRLGSGSFRFKKHWGFEAEALNYQYRLVKADRVPDRSASSAQLRFAVMLWKRLPLALANRLGPQLAPFVL